MKKLIIICIAVIFSATVYAQNGSSTGTNTSNVAVYKSPDILTDKAVAEAKKARVSNNVTPVVPPVGLIAHPQPIVQPATVVTKPVETTATPTAPVHLVSISANKSDVVPVTDQKPIIITSPVQVNANPVTTQADKTIPVKKD